MQQIMQNYMKMPPNPLHEKFLGFYFHGTCAPWATTLTQLFSHPILQYCPVLPSTVLG